MVYIFITTYFVALFKVGRSAWAIRTVLLPKTEAARMIYKHGIKHRYGSDLHSHSLTRNDLRWIRRIGNRHDFNPPLVSSHPQVEVSSPIAAFPFIINNTKSRANCHMVSNFYWFFNEGSGPMSTTLRFWTLLSAQFVGLILCLDSLQRI